MEKFKKELKETVISKILTLSSEKQNYWIWYSILNITLRDSFKYKTFDKNKLYITLPLNPDSFGGVCLGSYLLYPNVYMPSDSQLREELFWRNVVLQSKNKSGKPFSLIDLQMMRLNEIITELCDYKDSFLRSSLYEGEFFKSEWGFFKEELYIQIISYFEYLIKKIEKYKTHKAPNFLINELFIKIEDTKKIIQILSCHQH